MTRVFWAICLLICFAACGTLVLSCSGQPLVLTSAAINCHHRLVVAASADASCNDRLIVLEDIVATDPDCVAVYRDAGSGFSCIDHDGAADGR